jgi:hypothetical protein
VTHFQPDNDSRRTVNQPECQPFAGQTALITGAGRGIGQQIAVQLAQAGATRLALLARSRDQLSETARLVAEAGGSSLVVPTDLTGSTLVGLGGPTRQGAPGRSAPTGRLEAQPMDPARGRWVGGCGAARRWWGVVSCRTAS